MAGHSKWKNIQHRKGRQDAKRAKIFTKISKEIFAAVKSGGTDPTINTRLRIALIKAKESNMPSDNIDRTIKKASGDIDGIQYEEFIYEGYGPGGVAVLVEILTDNRNRTAADVRHVFNKNGGNLGESGCVSFLFNRKGILAVAKNDTELSEEEIMLYALEAGAEDFQEEEEHFEIITTPNDFEYVQQALEQKEIPVISADISMLPVTTVYLQKDDALQMMKLMDALEDNDDVQTVHANFDIDEEVLANIG